jgi:hypothetical protein
MVEKSTRKYEIWECDSIIEQFAVEEKLNCKYRTHTLEVLESGLRIVRARRNKHNYYKKEDFVREVIETKIR